MSTVLACSSSGSDPGAGAARGRSMVLVLACSSFTSDSGVVCRGNGVARGLSTASARSMVLACSSFASDPGTASASCSGAGLARGLNTASGMSMFLACSSFALEPGAVCSGNGVARALSTIFANSVSSCNTLSRFFCSARSQRATSPSFDSKRFFSDSDFQLTSASCDQQCKLAFCRSRPRRHRFCVILNCSSRNRWCRSKSVCVGRRARSSSARVVCHGGRRRGFGLCKYGGGQKGS